MKEAYIITNYDNNYSTAIILSEEQAKAINWLIELADLDYSCMLAKDFKEEIE